MIRVLHTDVSGSGMPHWWHHLHHPHGLLYPVMSVIVEALLEEWMAEAQLKEMLPRVARRAQLQAPL